MSMPSSSELVATRARSSPRLSASSIESRCSRAIDPWCAFTSSSPGEIVELCREPLRHSPRVHEDEGAAMLTDQFEQAGMHVRPDARANRVTRGVVRRIPELAAELAHVFDGDHYLEVELLGRAGVDNRDRARSGLGATAEESRDLLEGSLRGRQSDALRRVGSELLESLERQREVRATLGARDRVDLVDDHGLDVAQHFARPRREHEVERLRCGDEDVGRRLHDPAAFVVGGVAGADRGARHARRCAQAVGRVLDPDQAVRGDCARCRRPAP